MNADLIIVGAGAAGLMAAVAAGEKKRNVLLLERKHQAGRKLLMCGNNRCNLTSSLSVPDMLDDYGEPVASFLRPSLQAFGPKELMQWFRKRRLSTVTHKDRRVFPSSEKASDVLHCFTDLLRQLQVPVMYNAAVTEVRLLKGGGFQLHVGQLVLETRQLLIATGGVSYPKTGSVGDGQKMAKALGHKVMPYRPGLVGFELQETWLKQHVDAAFPGAGVEIISKGKTVARIQGEVLCTRWGVSGPSMVNASRIIARENLRHYHFVVDLCPAWNADELARKLRAPVDRGAWDIRRQLGKTVMHPSLVNDFIRHHVGKPIAQLSKKDIPEIADVLKHWTLQPTKVRPLKEAMVTIGGVSLKDIDPQTMESRRVKGLFFAGEVMDIDGPTGGYNLQAAFSTAQTVIRNL